MTDFPPNSDASRKPEPEDKQISRVTTGETLRKKKGLGQRLKDTFIGGDPRSSAQYMVNSVLIPAAKDAMVEAISQGVHRLFFGDSRRGGSRPPIGGATGYVSYNRVPMGQTAQQNVPQSMTRQARARHDFDMIVLQSRIEAEEVIERMFDIISRYDTVTVADLYELTGIKGTHTDQKWGWTDMRGSGVSRVRNGFLLDLPEPEPLG